MQTGSKNKSLAILVLVIASFPVIVGCDSSERADGVVLANPVDAGLPQGHVAVSDEYTLRSNAIQSDTLAPQMLAQYGIEGGADRGMLNLVVLRQEPDGQKVTVTADVKARQANLMGQFREIEMKEITANNSTSYVGSFRSSPQEFFRFEITAQPVGSDKTLLIEFEEKFAVVR